MAAALRVADARQFLQHFRLDRERHAFCILCGGGAAASTRTPLCDRAAQVCTILNDWTAVDQEGMLKYILNSQAATRSNYIA